MRASERHLRRDFDSPGAEFNFGAVALARKSGNLSTVKIPVFLRRAIKPSVCSQLPIRTARPRSTANGTNSEISTFGVRCFYRVCRGAGCLTREDIDYCVTHISTT